MTSNKEDYLKEIYHMGGLRQNVSNKALAERLHVSPASVSEMLVKLRRGGHCRRRTVAARPSTLGGLSPQIFALSLERGARRR